MTETPARIPAPGWASAPGAHDPLGRDAFGGPLAPRRDPITTGLWVRMQHPNYLGGMRFNAANALLVMEGRLSRHPGWLDCTARPGFLFPNLRSLDSVRTLP